MRGSPAAAAVLLAAWMTCGGRAGIRAADDPVTFAGHVAPIVFTHCASCHRPDGAAPFSLLTYPDVRARARQLLAAVEARTMPPWKPEPGYGDFAGARRLTSEEIALFRKWVDTGMRLGDPRALPDPPRAAGGWQLGRPDLVLEVPAYRLAPGGDDTLRNFVVPTHLSARRHVRAWELRTTNPRVVHHATLVVDPTPASRRLDDADAEPGYVGLIPTSAGNPDGFFLGWTPGQAPSVAAAGTAWPIDRGSDLVIMLHMRPTDRWEPVSASVGLYFADGPPARTPLMIRLNRQDIDIPAGDPGYTITDRYTLPVDVDAIAVQPHAHTLAREIKGLATYADGSTRWLIYIRDWDFHWQDAYRFAAPVPLPAGTVVSMTYTYDNSAANPANRGRPLKRVIYGQHTSNEMGDLWIQVVPRREADAAELARSLRRKLVPQHIDGYRMMLRSDPDNPSLHDDLALLLFEAGDLEGVVREFSESLRLRPGAAAHYNVGNALLPLRRFDEAARHFRQALAAEPGYAPGHLGLGLVHEALGRPAEAADEYRRALALRPNWGDARARLDALERR